MDVPVGWAWSQQRFLWNRLLPAKIPANKQSIVETPDRLERQLQGPEQELQHDCLWVVQNWAGHYGCCSPQVSSGRAHVHASRYQFCPRWGEDTWNRDSQHFFWLGECHCECPLQWAIPSLADGARDSAFLTAIVDCWYTCKQRACALSGYYSMDVLLPCQHAQDVHLLLDEWRRAMDGGVRKEAWCTTSTTCSQSSLSWKQTNIGSQKSLLAPPLPVLAQQFTKDFQQRMMMKMG